MNTTIQNAIDLHLPWTERIWKQLKQADSVNSALFFGKTGLGKSHIALRYAMQLFEHTDVFLSGNHPDLHVLLPEDQTEEVASLINEEGVLAENAQMTPQELIAVYGLRYIEKHSGKAKKIISVQQIRSLIHQIVQHPSLAKHKVVIIQSADKMNTNAANALLKTLEEPPLNTSFILLADQIERLPITIRSRCMEFHFRAPDAEIGQQWLQQQGLAQHVESYLMMASRAPLSALELSEQNEIDNLRSLFSSINQLWAKKMSSIELANEWKNYSFNKIIKHLNQFLNDLLKLKLLKDSAVSATQLTELFYPVQSEWSTKIARSINIQELFATIDHFQSIQKLGDGPADNQLLLENAAIQLEKLALTRISS